MRPRLIVSVVPDCNSNGIDADCSKCDFNVDNCYSRTEDELSTPAERIAALTFALKELGVDVPQWQPIETAPKCENIVVGKRIDGQWCWWVDRQMDNGTWYEGESRVPTHWMPLPKPPKEAKR